LCVLQSLIQCVYTYKFIRQGKVVIPNKKRDLGKVRSWKGDRKCRALYWRVAGAQDLPKPGPAAAS
jgi:hypothetical protein